MATSRASSKRKVAVTQMHVALTSSSSFDDLVAAHVIRTGVGGFPLDECARLMVDVVRAHEARSLRRVVFAVFGVEAEQTFRSAL
jgi:O-acetyl-ADP-ribose deacetylase (regulator of RNase III)